MVGLGSSSEPIWGALRERAPSTFAYLTAHSALALQAERVLAASDFALRCLCQDDALLTDLDASGSLTRARQPNEMASALQDLRRSFAHTDEAGFAKVLRHTRRREMLRVAWRDLANLATTSETLTELSEFAAAAVDAAAGFAFDALAARHGPPAGDSPGLIVLAMGKLGGGELNFSSDIDLVLLHDSEAETVGPAVISSEEFYVRQARTLIRLLDAQTEDGFVFRVDLRLRPFGDSGPLVPSLAFFEDYLQTHGREWERYAYIKARAISGAAQFEAARDSVLRPFVYRRYLDFGVFEALREMKALIEREVARRDRAQNIKLGSGGIREIDFIAHAFPLVRGGPDGALRTASLLTVLPRLIGARLLPKETVEDLLGAYDFLRRLENRIQMVDDAQTHEMPASPQTRARLAAAMNLESAEVLEQDLARHRAAVAEHFAGLFKNGEASHAAAASLDLAPLWEAGSDEKALTQRLVEIQIEPADDIRRALTNVVSASRLKRLDETGRRRLKALLEKLLLDLPGQAAATRLAQLQRVFSILEAIGQRSAYFSLLVENAAARLRLWALCAPGDFLARQLAANPALLDELLEDRPREQLPTGNELRSEMQQRLAEVPVDDVERQVEALCRFKQAAVFRVARADLMQGLPLMQVSDRLTEIAELIVAQTMGFAWVQMTQQLGVPHCESTGEAGRGSRRPVRVAALGYGKLGGRELGYGSDLDLVFLHDSTGEQAETDRSSPVDNEVFFLRYAQRLLHLLTMHGVAGRLYEVDVRLRPSGKGGFLVTSLAAFERYQFEEAWTWEHQALLHARAVAGDPALLAQIEALRLKVLAGAVHRDDLPQKVTEMRERMRRELSSGTAVLFDLKQDRGGVADIEFLAQFWALRWAAEAPAVAMFSDTIRQLESVASANFVPQSTIDVLVGVYQRYRQVGHRLSLENRSAVLSVEDLAAAQLAETRSAVAAIWQQTFGAL